jgi:hypothetical protein
MKPEPSGRLISLDVLCGVTIGAMIIVTNLRTWSDTPRFPHLMHAEWHGCTLADLVFPYFLFIVGVTTVSSLDKRARTGESPLKLYRHIFTRSAILFLLSGVRRPAELQVVVFNQHDLTILAFWGAGQECRGGGSPPDCPPPKPPPNPPKLVARASCPGQRGHLASAAAIRGWGRELSEGGRG